MNGEVIFIRLFDVARFIDLNKVLSVLPGIREKKLIETKDTPDYLYIPRPIILNLIDTPCKQVLPISNLRLQAKIYEDGVITLIARLGFTNLPLEQLHNIRTIKFKTQDHEFDVNSWIRYHFDKIVDQIKPYSDTTTYSLDYYEETEYTLYCLNDPMKNPLEFVQNHNHYLANLLIGEKPDLHLHDSQINTTLEKTFSFLDHDLVIFDLERGLIIEPDEKEYDDILLITELANYQLLELRTLDTLLDVQLDKAEDSIRRILSKRRNLISRLRTRTGKDFRKLLRIRFDMIFILENLENISKIIGNYYLAQLYENLSANFRLDAWSQSIRNRLDILADTFKITSANVNEKILLFVEILLAVIFVLEFIFNLMRLPY